MKKNRSGNNTINDFIDWQNKQFTPWSYMTGGRLSPFVEAKGNPKRISITWFAMFLIIVFLGVIYIVGTNTTTTFHMDESSGEVHWSEFNFDFQESWPFILSFCILSIYCLFFGIKYWQRYRRFRADRNDFHNKRRKYKKNKTSKNKQRR
jgi:formate hydrogenlyase subunit 3/multisubunit Na+/H+ antiporter MnhD subunit